MKPLLVLLITFVPAIFAVRIINAGWNIPLAASIAMSAMLLFTSLGHFAFPAGMAMMMPAFIPFKKQIVWLTGILEIVAAATLLVPAWRHITAIGLLIFFVIILPANINAAIKKVDYQKATYDGNGINYLWFRVPVQLLYIAWVWFIAR